MYIDTNKLHGGHNIVNQIESIHHFVQGIVRALPLANHDRVLAHGTVPQLLLEPLNEEGNPLVHDTV